MSQPEWHDRSWPRHNRRNRHCRTLAARPQPRGTVPGDPGTAELAALKYRGHTSPRSERAEDRYSACQDCRGACPADRPLESFTSPFSERSFLSRRSANELACHTICVKENIARPRIGNVSRAIKVIIPSAT